MVSSNDTKRWNSNEKKSTWNSPKKPVDFIDSKDYETI